MKISVVIPVYNKECSILRAINSVINQSEQDFEIIIVNDGSIDQSVNVIKQNTNDKRICLIEQDNSGVSAARNRGVNEAHSDLIAFLDADDEWHPEFLKTILNLQEKFPEGSGFGTNYFIIEKDGNLKQPLNSALLSGYIDNYLDVLRYFLPFNMSSFAVTKSSFQKIGGFAAGVGYGEDVDLFIRLALRHKIVYSNQPLAIYHRDAENRACEEFEKEVHEYFPAVNLLKLLNNGDVPRNMKQAAIEYIAKSQLNLAKYYLYFGYRQRARDLILSSKGTKVYQCEWRMLLLGSLLPIALYAFFLKIKHIIHK